MRKKYHFKDFSYLVFFVAEKNLAISQIKAKKNEKIRTTLITLETGSIQASTFAYPCPRAMPATVKNTVQIRLPAVVHIRKGTSGISSIPAGTEIKVLIPGTNLPQKTKPLP